MKPFHSRIALVLLALNLFAAARSPGQGVSLVVPGGYLPEIPVLVRVELRTAEGRFDRSVWDAEAVLTASDPGVTLTPDRVTLRNGCGSVLVRMDGGGDFTLTAAIGAQSMSRLLEDLSGEGVLEVGGTLSGTETAWGGVVRLTNDLTVPVGHTLTVEAGTLVLIDGVESGRTAPDLFVRGTILSLGTPVAPVTFTCSDASLRWGQIDHEGAGDSVYRYTVISRGGRAAGEGHTGQGPAIDCNASSIRFENCTIADHAEVSPAVAGWGTPGKIMQATGGSSLVFEECLLTRSRMGPEISGTALQFLNSYIIDMRGDDDADAIYVHNQGAGQEVRFDGVVVAGTDDDGVDTLGARALVQDTIVRDVFDKGMSFLGGELHVAHCLNVNCGIGISSKANDGQTITTRIWNSTLVGLDRGIAAENKGGGSPNAVVRYFVTNCIIRAAIRPDQTVYTDYDPVNMEISYSTTVTTNWPGAGNLTMDPLFVDGLIDFRLQPASPCIDAGDPASMMDADGTRADMGFHPVDQRPSPSLMLTMSGGDGSFRFSVLGGDGEVYDIEGTERFESWTNLGRVTNSGGMATVGLVMDPFPHRFFRAVRVP